MQLEPDVNKLRRMKRSVLGRRVVNKVKRPEENIPSISKYSLYFCLSHFSNKSMTDFLSDIFSVLMMKLQKV